MHGVLKNWGGGTLKEVHTIHKCTPDQSAPYHTVLVVLYTPYHTVLVVLYTERVTMQTQGHREAWRGAGSVDIVSHHADTGTQGSVERCR